MASTTINLSANTWYFALDTVNHSSASWLRITRASSTGAPRDYKAVLQFTIPITLKYKKINKVSLYCYSRWTSLPGELVKGMDIAPYIADGTALSNLTGSTVDNYGEKGEFVNVEKFADFGMHYPGWRNFDITSLFNSNLYNDTYFSVIMAGFPGYIGPNDQYYGEIGGIGSGYAAYLVIDYEDAAQLPPTPVYPAGIYVNENTDLLFSWAWNAQTQAVQASVQLEYKLKSAQSYTVLSLTQTSHTYKLVSGLPQGTYQWRLKGTNDVGETSDYSNVEEFTVIGKPTVPVINAVPNRALTEITWNAAEQLSADITLVDSTGMTVEEKTISSPEAEYKPNIFLKGVYTFGVRVRNSTGLSSDWAYKTFNITAAGPTKPAMRLSRDDVQIRIALEQDSGTRYAVIRKEDRDGAKEKILGYVDNGVFIDKTFALGTVYRYVVRAYSTGGYTDSNPERAICHKAAVVLETSDDEVVLDRSENTFLPYAEDSQRDYSVFKAVGRKYPVVEHGDGENWSFRSNLFVTEDQKERIKAMAMKNKIFYRDYSGRAFPVAIETLSFTRYMGEGYMADIQFLRISEEEVIINV